MNRTLLMPSLSASLFYKEVELLKPPISFDKVFKFDKFNLLCNGDVHCSYERIELDWMIHCKNLERRLNITEICSSKEEIMERVGNIVGLKTPAVVYLAVADSLLQDPSILNGWKEGLVPFEKKKLGFDARYKKFPYLIQSAIDYEVCLRADVFVGNSFSTFSSLIALDRTQKLIKMGVNSSCGIDVRWPTYAYNILGDQKGPQKWMTNMSGSSLKEISYGSNQISC
ncbi:hypothetical protein J5N97_000688 [Dioscorea zingiberensis]|uniref:O-fucosyltransferase family protein n=1 Tax=Dioscorea zingiberensis TaxID=325984 RepID=A0A9D5BW43_9LILI|nr:hypothetical protein J5N97_000688 [Dioscorea zingiberensis]